MKRNGLLSNFQKVTVQKFRLETLGLNVFLNLEIFAKTYSGLFGKKKKEIRKLRTPTENDEEN